MKRKMRVFLLLFCCMLLLEGCARPRYRNAAPPTVNAPPSQQPRAQQIAVADYAEEVQQPAPMLQRNDFRPLIVIDPGHGGKDMGCESFLKPKAFEKNLALSTALMVNQYLKKMGFKTLMTRKEDVFIPLDNRADFANARGSALFVSVHYNSAPSREAQGVEVYYYKSDDDPKRSADSKKLAGVVLDKIGSFTQAKSRGVKHGNFAVIRKTKMPAILVEAGFLTNDEEAQRLRDPVYLKRLAYGIAQGIKQHLSSGTGFVR